MTSKQFNEISPRKTPPVAEEPLFGYHIHIYFEAGSADEKKAVALFGTLDAKFPDTIDNIHRVAKGLGPHLQTNIGAFIPPDEFGKVVGWLQRNSDGLSILVHPITNDELKDHRDSPLWLGKPVPLDISFFEPAAPKAKGPKVN